MVQYKEQASCMMLALFIIRAVSFMMNIVGENSFFYIIFVADKKHYFEKLEYKHG